MTNPLILKVRNSRNIHIYANNTYEMENLYKSARYVNDYTEYVRGSLIQANQMCIMDVIYLPLIGNGGWTRVTFSFNRLGEDGHKKSFVIFDVCMTDEAMGHKSTTSVMWEINRATVENVDGDHRNVRITFYNNDSKILTVDSVRDLYRRYDFRHRCGEFVFDGSNKKKKEEKEGIAIVGGCLMCDNSVYEKENGIIYLKCTKYEGRVEESTYTGEAYPEYCKRRR